MEAMSRLQRAHRSAMLAMRFAMSFSPKMALRLRDVSSTARDWVVDGMMVDEVWALEEENMGRYGRGLKCRGIVGLKTWCCLVGE